MPVNGGNTNKCLKIESKIINKKWNCFKPGTKKSKGSLGQYKKIKSLWLNH